MNSFYSDVECPYCGGGQDIDHSDGYGFEQGETHQQECVHCSKIFIYQSHISFSYDVDKADCLNGAEHDWQLTKTIPEMRRMHCSMCDQKRECTDEERVKFNLPPLKKDSL